MGIRIIQSAKPLCDPQVRTVRDRLRSGDLAAAAQGAREDVPAIVRRIIADVEARGDQAVAEWTARLDRAPVTPQTIRVPPERIAEARKSASAEFLALARRVAGRIRSYQESILLKAPPALKGAGRELALRYSPIDRVGIYVPGGQAAYPSSLLMTVVPAQVAGVPEIVLASPPRSAGEVNPLVLALAGELGIDEVYRAGGAVAMAAMAVGTQTIRAVDKLCGPGGSFGTEAKRQLLGRVGIDSLAGPSEVLIIADHTADPRWLAADMLAQAEHDPGSAVLVTTSQELAREVAAAMEDQLARMERREATRKAVEEYSAVIVVPDLQTACDAANDFAGEHVQVITADDECVLARIRHAGAIFLGPHSPVPVGDYIAGPSHVLPTGGTARFFSALSCNDFLKASSVIRYDRQALQADAQDVIDFATLEGLTGHAEAVRIRGKH